MLEDYLYRAVAKFAQVTQDVADAQLDLEWSWGEYDSEGVRFAFFRTYEELRQLATRLAAERQAHAQAATTVQRALSQYHAAYRDLQAALLGIEDENAQRVPTVGEWPIQQVVAHIVRAELGFYKVVRYALDRHRIADGRPAEIPDNVWENLTILPQADFDELLSGPLAGIRSFHQDLHTRVLSEFASISDQELQLPSMYWEGYPLSLQFRLHRFDSHCRQHTIQLDKTMAVIRLGPTEARRLLRLLYAALAQAEGANVGAWDIAVDLQREVAQSIAMRADEITSIVS
jgi:hypothetical protein